FRTSGQRNLSDTLGVREATAAGQSSANWPYRGHPQSLLRHLRREEAQASGCSSDLRHGAPTTVQSRSRIGCLTEDFRCGDPCHKRTVVFRSLGFYLHYPFPDGCAEPHHELFHALLAALVVEAGDDAPPTGIAS